MGLLGGAASSGMQKTYKQNNALGNRKKSLKDRTKGYDTKSTSKFEEREMTEEQNMAHESQLKKNKSKDQIRMVILWGLIAAIIGAFAYFLG